MGTFVTVLVILAVLAALAFLYWTLLSFTCARPIGADEVYELTTPDLWQVRLYRFIPEGGPGEPVFLCHSMMSNHRNFTAPRGASMVDKLLERGFDCWCIDLRGSRSCKPPYEWSRFAVRPDDYLLRDIPAALDFIRSRTGYGRVHWVGHSLGGMMLYAWELAFGRDWVGAGVTLGSPPGFGGVSMPSPAPLLFLVKLFPRGVEFIMRAVTPLLSAVRPRLWFVPVNWGNMHPGVDTAVFFNMLECAPPGVARRVARWAATNEWVMDHGQVDVAGRLNELKTPLMAFYGAADPLVRVANARAFMEGLATDDRKMVVLSEGEGYSADYNHVDLAFGRAASEEVFAPAADWLEAHPITDRVEQGQEVEFAFRVEQVTPRTGDGELAPPTPPAGKRKGGPAKPAAKKTPKSRKKKAAAKGGKETKKPAKSAPASARGRTKKKPATKKKGSSRKKPAASRKKKASTDDDSTGREPGK